MTFRDCGIVGISAVVALLFSAPASAGTPELDQAVAAWAGAGTTGDQEVGLPPAYRFAFADLNGDSTPDAVVLIDDRQYCGTGGCTMVVFEGAASGFKLVSRSTITREPIFVLPGSRHGWRSLAVWSSGGGATSRKVLMAYDGSGYPLNPSLQPTVPAKELEAGTKLQFR